MRIEETVRIAAPIERVWAETLDVTRWPEWTPTMESVELLDDAPVAVGSRVRLKQPDNAAAVWTVTRIDAPECFEWETRALGMRVVARHVHRRAIDATGSEGTEVDLVIDVSGPTAWLLGGLVRRASERFLPQEAAALKARCED